MSLSINNNYGTVNHIENSNVTINNSQLTAEPGEPVQLAEEITPIPTKPRGPKVQYLFADVNRNEDAERTRHEAERVKRYIADHHMGNMHLDSTNTNQLNLLVACFYYEWREREWVSAQPQGAAIHRFLTEQCSLPCDVTPRAYARTIADLIKGNHKDYNISDNLRSYFK